MFVTTYVYIVTINSVLHPIVCQTKTLDQWCCVNLLKEFASGQRKFAKFHINILYTMSDKKPQQLHASSAQFKTAELVLQVTLLD